MLYPSLFCFDLSEIYELCGAEKAITLSKRQAYAQKKLSSQHLCKT